MDKHNSVKTTLYVAVDIGCIECGEKSNVIGIFTSEEQAQKICSEYEKRQRKHWSGDHYFEVFSISGIDEPVPIEYTGGFDLDGDIEEQRRNSMKKLQEFICEHEKDVG